MSPWSCTGWLGVYLPYKPFFSFFFLLNGMMKAQYSALKSGSIQLESTYELTFYVLFWT